MGCHGVFTGHMPARQSRLRPTAKGSKISEASRDWHSDPTTASRVGGAARAGHAAGGARSAPQTSAMSAIPIQLVPSVTGNCRNPPCTMILAASRILVVAGMAAGPAVKRSWIRVLFTSMPSATATVISASVITPIGRLPCRAPSTTQGGRPGVFHQVGGSDVPTISAVSATASASFGSRAVTLGEQFGSGQVLVIKLSVAGVLPGARGLRLGGR